MAKEMRARVALGHDPQGENKERKREAVRKIKAEKLQVTMGQLAGDYFAAQILGCWRQGSITQPLAYSPQLVALFKSMRTAKGWNSLNMMAVKMLLLLTRQCEELVQRE